MLLIADKFVMNLICHARKDIHLLDTISKQMVQLISNSSIDWWVRQSCLSTKQFKRKFIERVGVNPKMYTKIIRFTKAFNAKNRYPNIDWLRIAIECGYFDYPHLVKDYKGFTKMNPNEFHLLESNSPQAILGLTDDLYRDRF